MQITRLTDTNIDGGLIEAQYIVEAVLVVSRHEHGRRRVGWRWRRASPAAAPAPAPPAASRRRWRRWRLRQAPHVAPVSTAAPATRHTLRRRRRRRLLLLGVSLLGLLSRLGRRRVHGGARVKPRVVHIEVLRLVHGLPTVIRHRRRRRHGIHVLRRWIVHPNTFPATAMHLGRQHYTFTFSINYLVLLSGYTAL